MSRSDYWQHKLSVFLHDPVHKCLRIQGHEARAAEIAGLLHQRTPGKPDYQAADWIASGLTRAALPEYSADAEQNGAVDFMASPVLTHPLVQKEHLALTLPAGLDVDAVHQDILALLKADIGEGLSADELDRLRLEQSGTVPMNAHFSYSNAPEDWSRALFAYLFFAFKKRLRAADVGGLGALWDFLPADTRMPDHALWHHCGLASALASAMADDPDGKISLGVFSITPVQPFIAKARKLRDHWVGSVILSYLAFAGLRHLARTLGPDHVMYPSLHNQPLVESWLDREYHLGAFLDEPVGHVRAHNEAAKGIASFPNKFVFLAGTARAEDIHKGVEQAVQAEWLRLAGMVRDFMAPRGEAGAVLRGLFDQQVSDYWQFSFASVRLLGLGDGDGLSTLLHPEKFQNEQEVIHAFAAPYGDDARRMARFYAATHAAAQSLLAASKLKPNRVRKAQYGEKCPLCGEHEVLHDFQRAGMTRAVEYKEGVKAFWDRVRERMNSEGSHAQVGKSERLCAVCCVKRFLPQALHRHPEELLYEVLRKDADKFPSTTEIAAHDYLLLLESVAKLSPKEIRDLVNQLHEEELEAQDDEKSQGVQRLKALAKKRGIEFTPYYAMLMMDGDKMGELINGATIEAHWGDVIHPELKQRIGRSGFAPRSPLRPRLNQPRTLNPALHAAISDSLNGFARYGAAPAVRKGAGRLIYAGGDDICTILPLGSALETADLIRRAYTMGFVRITPNGVEPIDTQAGPLADRSGKLGLHLGTAAGISISGAIVIAHHKTPLREVIRDAHALLSGAAKNKAGRNALALRLSKRSGGDREVVFKWDEPNRFMEDGELLVVSFTGLMQDVVDEEVSSRLLYRLANLRDALAPLVTDAAAMQANRDRILRLFRYEITHSGKFLAAEDSDQLEIKIQRLAGRLAGICVRKPFGEADWFTPDAAIVAQFLAHRRAKGEQS